MIAPGMKRCSKCCIEKDKSCFSKNSWQPDGLQSQCKQCVKEYNQARREEKAVHMRTYNETHRDELLEYSRKYDQAHRDKRAAYNRKYWLEHPEVMRAGAARHRALLNEAEGTFTADEWLQMLAETDCRCAYCFKQSDDLTMDHVVPLVKGGRHDVTNIVPACKSCNGSKHDKDLLFFLHDRATEKQ